MTRLSVLGALTLALALTACDSSDPIVTSCDNESLEISIDTLAVGTSPAQANPNDRVLVNYRGTLTDGAEFDSGTNIAFTLTNTVSGFREGITGMRLGGERRVTVPPLRGYGTQERQDADGNVVIPPCSVLIFEVELIDILS
ncbi:MAG: FKBP-type peptidyl-prolyl cis-trans isomerase [Bacteroidota bacterium]